ncbi:hypothetical protein RvY_08780 [Ramazzottius varieornatus]|uniref:Uncharacterized protein n=1 Tax=Ramazzottius varieornatus TaxID=947166 RepID=A0A1D1VG86_RAMVA|nr:hypothetical protein RvY_08780 [Ramazzottius varieornatus]
MCSSTTTEDSEIKKVTFKPYAALGMALLVGGHGWTVKKSE